MNNKQLFLFTDNMDFITCDCEDIILVNSASKKLLKNSESSFLNYKLINNVINEKEINAYCKDFYDVALSEIKQLMNRYHNLDEDCRYWEILIGPWLSVYLKAFYYRYLEIKNALNAWPNGSAVILCERDYYVPKNTVDFAELAMDDDLYNMQLYSQIFSKLTSNFIRYTGSEVKKEKVLTDKSFFKKIIGTGINKWSNKSTTILRYTYFNRIFELKLMLMSLGKIGVWVGVDSDNELIETDKTKRERLKNIFVYDKKYDDEFEKIFYENLINNIPRTYLEGYHGLEQRLANYTYPNALKLVDTNGWIVDEAYKLFCAKNYKRVILCGMQHGGNYGNQKYVGENQHKITDLFYTWGWKSDSFQKAKPIPSNKLIYRKRKKKLNFDGGIFYVTTQNAKYLYGVGYYGTEHNQEYENNQLIFLNSLSEKLIKYVKIRTRTNDENQEIVREYKKIYPKLKIETMKVKFIKSLYNSKLYVCDHLSTTFIEALYANIPTILFWDPQSVDYMDEAVQYFELLRENGILHDTPEAAAIYINTIYENLEDWWFDRVRQNAILKFCENYAYMPRNFFKVWKDELLNYEEQ